MAYSVARTDPVPDLFALCDEIITRIPPHETIYRPDSGVRDAQGRVQPYLLRWHLRPKQTGRSQFALYLHRFLQPDETVLHDHPWPSASWLLFGEQSEVWKTAGGVAGPPSRHQLVPGNLVCRPAAHAHCLGLPRDDDGTWIPATTLFATGRRVRDWGFWPEGRFVPEAEYQSRLSAIAARDAA